MLTSIPVPSEGCMRQKRGAAASVLFLQRSAKQGFRSCLRSAQQGFTLVELLVVLAIVGLATSAVILAMPPRTSALMAERDALALRLAALRDEAVVSGRPIGLELRGSGYRFSVLRDGEWVQIVDRPFRSHMLREGVAAKPATLRFDSSGVPAGPPLLELRQGGQRASLRIEANGRVRIS